MMATLEKTLITSRDPQGRSIVNLFEAVFDKTGLRPDEVQYLIENGDRFQDGARSLLQRIAVGCPVSCDVAASALGSNMWGVGDWQETFQVQFTKSQLAKVAKFPWSETILTRPCPFNPGKLVKDTHFAFLGIEQVGKTPLTICKFWELFPATGQPRFYSYGDSWCENQKFANEPTCNLRWYLMLKEIVPGSENKTWNEQQPLIPSEYEVPEAVVDVAKHLLYCKKVGGSLNANRYGRTASLASGGRRVNVGRCDPGGLRISSDWDDRQCDYVGLSVSRKLGI